MTTCGRRAFAWHGARAVSRRAALATAVGLALSLSRAAPAAVPAVDMTEVRRLARDPVETIFAGVAIGRVSAPDYWKTVRGSKKPVVVIFYANQDERSRNLATLARYLALEFHVSGLHRTPGPWSIGPYPNRSISRPTFTRTRRIRP
jgi:hypothetical protein